jgi:hypothetical protein
MAKLLILPTGQTSRGEPVWHAFVCPGPYSPEEAEGLAREVASERIG